MRIPQSLYGIIGWPLGHTLSPLLHNWAFDKLGLAAAYTAFPTPPEKLRSVISAVRALPIKGLSVTIPHKQTVMPLLDAISPAAKAIGAVNTLYWEGHLLVGENTDIEGFAAPLKASNHTYRSALVLGIGGAARAALAALRDLGVPHVSVSGRDPMAALALAREFNCGVVTWEVRGETKVDLLVNATPLGMAGTNVGQTPWPSTSLRPGQTVYDMVYNPRDTRLIREAAVAGCTIIHGLEMFLGQAAGQLRRWTGVELPWEGARRLMLEAMGMPGAGLTQRGWNVSRETIPPVLS